MPIDIELINTYAAKATISAWFMGLAYFNWFASAPAHVQLWVHLLLVTVGMGMASVLIGGGVALIMALITKILTGDAQGSPDIFAWGALMSPPLAFFAAKYALNLAAAL